MEFAGNHVKINDNKGSLNFAINGYSDQIYPIMNYLFTSLIDSKFINDNSINMAKIYLNI